MYSQSIIKWPAIAKWNFWDSGKLNYCTKRKYNMNVTAHALWRIGYFTCRGICMVKFYNVPPSRSYPTWVSFLSSEKCNCESWLVSPTARTWIAHLDRQEQFLEIAKLFVRAPLHMHCPMNCDSLSDEQHITWPACLYTNQHVHTIPIFLFSFLPPLY